MADRFYGTFTPRLDDKARLTLPHRYREAFQGGGDGGPRTAAAASTCSPPPASTTSPKRPSTPRSRTRWPSARRGTCSRTPTSRRPDAQGRILLTARMREFAGLDRDLVLTGQGRRMEIWDADRWASYEAEQEAAYVDADAGVAGAVGSQVSPAVPGPAERPGAPD